MRVLAVVLFALLAPNPTCAQVNPTLTSTNRANFAGKDVRRGANIWFFSTVKAERIAANQTKIFFRNSRIRFRANGTDYSIGGPDGSITFSPAAGDSSTTYDYVKNEYHTVVPLSYTGRVFLAGILFIVPEDVGLKLRTGQVVWEGEFYSSTVETRLAWQWEARAYWGGTAEYQDISVEPTDAARNCADAKNNWWYGILCLPIGESKDKYLPVASSGALAVTPIWDIPRRAPTAIARLTQPADVGAPVQLDGTRSYSVTGRPLSYAWTFESTPDGKFPLLAGADSATPTLIPTREGKHALQLVVSDAGVRSPPSTIGFWTERVRWDKSTFSLPGSVLLFWGYGDVLLVQPSHLEALSRNATRPSISRNGDLVAWITTVPDESARVVPLEVSVNSREYLETPLRSSLAIYSVPDRRTVTFPMGQPNIKVGDTRDSVDDIAISPDGRRVALIGCPTDCSKLSGLFLLEIATGKISPPLFTNIPGRFDSKTSQFSGRRWAKHPTWSPDGTHLVFQLEDDLAILDIQSREIKTIAKGTDPSWSPTGEWIAYFDEFGKRCRIIRPDGTDQKTLKELGGIFRRVFAPWVSFEQSPVWSPDGKKLLLTIYLGETLRLAPVTKVVLLDLATGKTKRMRKNALMVAGWASQKTK